MHHPLDVFVKIGAVIFNKISNSHTQGTIEKIIKFRKPVFKLQLVKSIQYFLGSAQAEGGDD